MPHETSDLGEGETEFVIQLAHADAHADAVDSSQLARLPDERAAQRVNALEVVALADGDSTPAERAEIDRIVAAIDVR